MNSVFARHGRLIFGVITVIIIVSFMGILRPGGMADIFSRWGNKNVYGEIFGEKQYPAMMSLKKLIMT